MITKKKLQTIAKIMYKNSFTGKFVDQAKVKRNLAVIFKEKPQGTTKILKIYGNLISRALATEEVTIESSDKLSTTVEKDLLKKTGAKKITYKIRPQTVFGAKITHGDWVYENNLDSKINEMANIE